MGLVDNKPFMLLTFAVILVLAIIIGYQHLSKPQPVTGIEGVDPEEVTWIKCKNPDCAFEYRTGKKEYFQHLQKASNPMDLSIAPVACEKCGQETAYRALKCENCDKVFFYGESEDFVDRCTECGFSKTEESRKLSTE